MPGDYQATRDAWSCCFLDILPSPLLFLLASTSTINLKKHSWGSQVSIYLSSRLTTSLIHSKISSFPSSSCVLSRPRTLPLFSSSPSLSASSAQGCWTLARANEPTHVLRLCQTLTFPSYLYPFPNSLALPNSATTVTDFDLLCNSAHNIHKSVQS